MIRMSRSLVALAALAAAARPLAAQAGHRHEGESPEQLGRVVFPISCGEAAQAPFERAMALLHSFWWDEAGAAFRALAEADPDCGMAQWGMALTQWGNPFAGGPSGAALDAGAAAARRAAELRAGTARERGYIAAAAALYRDHASTSNAQRLRAYSDAMAEVYRQHPDDAEAAIYYALSLVATASATDTTFARQKQAHAILEPLFRARPDHPGLAHYVIHANDSPRLAAQGLAAARRYAEIAPAVPHAQHMPTHIFIRLGLWQENIDGNRRSYEAGARYAKEQGWGGLGAHEFHAMDYMVYGYLQFGADSAARHWVDHALAVTDIVPPGGIVSEYARAAMPARFALERGQWADAARLPVVESPPAARVVSHFARGIGAARSGDAAEARQAMTVLGEIATALAERDAYWARVAGIKRQAVGAWVALAEGDTAQALAEARAAADAEDVTEKHPVTPGEVLPARELYADLLLEAGRHADARRAYEATLERERGRGRALFGAGRAAELAGDVVAARQWFTRYLELMADGDGTRPELTVARKLQ